MRAFLFQIMSYVCSPQVADKNFAKMPNHIQCRLKFIGTEKNISELREHIKGEYGDKTPMQIDFNKIKPMPQCLGLQIHSGIEHMVKRSLLMPSHSNQLIAMLESSNTLKAPSPLTLSDEEWEMYIQCLRNVRETGHISWYGWRVENWGTKWNAYQQNDKRNTDDTIFFQTAWSAPVDLIEQLHTMFSNVGIEFTYADEDSGCNVGRVYFSDGIKTKEDTPDNQSIEAWEIYFELHPERRADYHLVDGQYEYIDSE